MKSMEDIDSQLKRSSKRRIILKSKRILKSRSNKKLKRSRKTRQTTTILIKNMIESSDRYKVH